MEKENNLKFTKTHEWLRQDNNNLIIGITEHAGEMLGDVVFVDLKKPGENVIKGDSIGVIESVKAASDIYAPVSGKIIEINQDIIEKPGLLNEDPLGAGWLVKIESQDLAQIDTLLDSVQYLQQIKESD